MYNKYENCLCILNTLSHPLCHREASEYMHKTPCRACKNSLQRDWHSHTTSPPDISCDDSYFGD